MKLRDLWPAREKATETLQVRMPPSTKDKLIAMKINAGLSSLTELTQLSLALFDVVESEMREKGAVLVLKYHDGSEKEIELPNRGGSNV